MGNRIAAYSPGALLCLTACSLTLLAQAPVSDKPASRTKQASVAGEKPLDPNFVRWRVYLDTLAQVARSVPDERRPYVVTDVALAYWEFDRDEARRQFTAALDEAIKFVQQDKRKYEPMLTYVMNTACKLDVELAKELTKRLASKSGDKNADSVTMWNAVDLLKTDKQAAIQLVKGLAPAGLKDGSAMEFILELSSNDPNGATELYNLYLRQAASDESLHVGTFAQFAGYAFGWYEYYVLYADGDMSGRSGGSSPLRACVRKCEADGDLVRAVLLTTQARLQRALSRRDQEPSSFGAGEAAGLLWEAEYFISLISMRGPVPPEWQQLRDRSAIGVDQEKISMMQHNATTMQQQRERLRNFAEKPDAMDEFTDETILGKIDSTLGACERDLLYMRGVTNYSYRKNFKHAQELLDKVSDEARTEKVKNFFLNDMVAADVRSRDLDAARTRIRKITVPLLVIANMIDLTKALFESGDRIEAGRTATETAAMIEKIQEPKDRTGMYFGLAGVLVKDDAIEARSLLDKAIKNLNKLDPEDNWRYVFLHQILMSCDAKAHAPAYGGNFAPQNSTVFDAVRLFSKSDLDQTDSAADSITDKATKLRAQAIVARAALAKYRSTAK